MADTEGEQRCADCGTPIGGGVDTEAFVLEAISETRDELLSGRLLSVPTATRACGPTAPISDRTA